MKPLSVSAVLLSLLGPAQAQNFPNRQITILVPFGAGGSVDGAARVLAPALADILGQQIVVENQGGGGGSTASKRVATAPPDGYLLVLGNSGTHTYSQALYKTPVYNAATDFAPIGIVAETQKILLVRNDLPIKTLPDFVAYAKAHDGEMKYGSAGPGSGTHIACVMLNAVMKTTAIHVPYRGTGPAMADLMGGRLDYLCEVAPVAAAQARMGAARAVAILSPDRMPTFPELQTSDEQGLKGVDVDAWNALFAPKGTPDAVVRRLSDAVDQALADPVLRERLATMGYGIPPKERQGPAYLAKILVTDIEKWTPVIKSTGITQD